MTVLFGHPTGSPNAHQAALAHFEAGRLEAFCVSWVPSIATLRILDLLPGVGSRIARRRFAPLAGAPTVQGRWREWLRLAGRIAGADHARLMGDANDWLMHTMSRALERPRVTAVHAFEDCALRPFEAAGRQGKARIYDMPIAYYPAWQRRLTELTRRYGDWLPSAAAAGPQASVEQKRSEMAAADLVLVPCRFAEDTVREFAPQKRIARAPYGVDDEFWSPPPHKPRRERLRFVFAGQISLRKGMPTLIEAWRKAALDDAELELVGPWHLAGKVRGELPPGIVHRPPCGPNELRARYRAADVVVFPSHFEGFGLALIEGMACGLPALASDAGIAPELITAASGRVLPSLEVDAWVAALRWCAANRDALPAMGQAARAQASQFTWQNYRRLVSEAVAPYV